MCIVTKPSSRAASSSSRPYRAAPRALRLPALASIRRSLPPWGTRLAEGRSRADHGAMTPPPRGRGPVRWPLAVLLALGAVTYSAWLLETVLGTGLDPVQSYVSELAATDQRLGGLFRTTDLVSGVLVLTAALGALARSERRPLTVAGWVALALFGAATAADSRLPLSCTPTADAACAAREDAGDVPFTHLAHAVSSSLAMAGALAGVAALTLAARRYGHWPAVARTGSVLAVAAAAATVWTLAGVAAFEAERGH